MKPEESKKLTLLEKIDWMLTRPLGRVEEKRSSSSLPRRKGLIRTCRGMTFLEVSVAAAGVMTMFAIAVPSLEVAREDMRVHEAVTDITVIQFAVTKYELRYGTIPADTAALNLAEDVATDPWGHPYVYLNYATPDPADADPRKDQFLKPINTAYDVYRTGPDGLTHRNLSNTRARDDIVRAVDGGYIGVAEDF